MEIREVNMKKIIIDHTEDITKTALLHDGKLIELVVDGQNEMSIAGNIYAGIVEAILPSQFAFIDIGLEKNAFLHLNDNRETNLYGGNQKKLLIKRGQTLLVQVLKDPAKSKGAYVTSRLSFAGRFVVIEKSGGAAEIGVSSKITNEAERERLKDIFRRESREGYAVVVRTDAAGRREEELLAEHALLMDKLEKSENEWRCVRAPALVFSEDNVLRKTLSDFFKEETDEVVVNDKEVYESLKLEFAGFFDGAGERFSYYGDSLPVFSKYSVDAQIEKAMRKKVWLDSGAFIVIEQTEACVVIDVNSGKYSGAKGHEQTALEVNSEAAIEVAYQLRLRNLGGIIIVDFIDMKLAGNIDALTKVLREETQKDRLAVNVVGMTELGLMQLTRKKVRRPLADILSQNDSLT